MTAATPHQSEEITAEPIPWESESLHSSIQHDSSWLISFIDILTILLTVFVLLLAYDQHKPVGISEMESTLEPTTQPASPVLPEPMEQAVPYDGELEHFIESLQTQFKDDLTIDISPEQIKLDLADTILFERASAELTEAGIKLLQSITEDLQFMPYNISVEGHTDNTPIKTDRYPSNWELSTARASIVTRTLIDNGIAPGKLRAIGYGDTRPVVENINETNKAKNRRVSFVLELPKDMPEADF
jgi:chemotaxis protein MotB